MPRGSSAPSLIQPLEADFTNLVAIFFLRIKAKQDLDASNEARRVHPYFGMFGLEPEKHKLRVVLALFKPGGNVSIPQAINDLPVGINLDGSVNAGEDIVRFGREGRHGWRGDAALGLINPSTTGKEGWKQADDTGSYWHLPQTTLP